eukprot:Colp12_sorted_trinity150504_noHs@27750
MVVQRINQLVNRARVATQNTNTRIQYNINKVIYDASKTIDAIRYGKKESTCTVASVPFMITNKMRMDLGALGLSATDIDHLTPIQAHRIISAGLRCENVPLAEILARTTPPPEPEPSPASSAPVEDTTLNTTANLQDVAEADMTQVDSVTIDSSQLDSTQVNSTQVDSTQVSSVDSKAADPTQVMTYVESEEKAKGEGKQKKYGPCGGGKQGGELR